MVLAVVSCTVDDEPAPQYAKGKLMEKKWYLKGKSGQSWVLYKQDGKWENSAGDYGSWSLVNGNELRIKATNDLLQNWEEEIIELTDTYLKTRVKGVSIAKEYEITP